MVNTGSDAQESHGDLGGTVALITGTRGIGLEVASALHRRGAATYIVGRDEAAGAAAAGRLERERPDVPCGYEPADVGDLTSLRRLRDRLSSANARLDMLINNAGVVTSARELTSEGWERNFGVNYLGHFALTGLMLPLLRAAPAPRVVSVTSRGIAKAKLRLDDPQFEQRFNPMAAYAASKLALLSFGLQLNVASERNQWGIASYVAHPGICPTNIMDGAIRSPGAQRFVRRLYGLMGHSPANAAQSVLRCATDRTLPPGTIMGPSGMMEMRGKPAPSSIARFAPQPAEAERLWELSQEMTAGAFPARA